MTPNQHNQTCLCSFQHRTEKKAIICIPISRWPHG